MLHAPDELSEGSTGDFSWWRLFRPSWPGLSLLMAALLVQMVFYAALPISFSTIIDSALPEKDWGLLNQIFFWLGAGAIAFIFAGLIQDWILARLVAGLLRDLRSRMFHQLLRMSSRNFTAASEVDIMARFSGDIASIEGLMIVVVPTVIQPGLQVLLNSVLLFLFDWRLAICSLLVWPVCLAGPLLFGRRAIRTSFARKEEETSAVTQVQQSVSAHHVIRAFSLSRLFRSRFQLSNESLYQATTSLHEYSFQAQRLAEIGVVILQMLVICMGAVLVLRGWLTVGVLVAFEALFLELSDSLCLVMQSMPQFIQSAGSARRVHELLHQRVAVMDSLTAQQFNRLRDSIALKNVSFSYDGTTPHVDNLSFTIRKGQTVALVGPSGCGKTTVLNLLLRHFDADAGSLLIDGYPITEYKQESLRAQMAPVLQDTYIFLNASIRENIRVGRLQASDEEVQRAAEFAGLHDLITAQPQQYDTVLGPRAARLSGEDRVRLALARAWLRSPTIVLLDEATAALDPAAEAAVREPLQKLCQDRTVLLVTHRLAHAASADQVLYMENGHAVESGTHQELLALKGRYADLWQKQSGFVISNQGQSVRIEPDRLRAIPILSGLNQDFLTCLASRMETESYAADRPVVQESDPGNKFYIIARGRVEVHRQTATGQRQPLTILSDGDYFGELALLRNSPRTASVSTLSACSFLVLSRRNFLDLLADAPEVREQLEEVAALRK